MIRLIVILFFLPVFIQIQPTEDWLTPFASVEGLQSTLDDTLQILDPDSLPPPLYFNDNLTIETGQTIIWDNIKAPNETYIAIESGATLIIKDTVYVKPNTKIVVKQGGKLELDNGAIIGLCTWQGIEVWGNSTSSLTADQGLLVLKNGSVIENAQTAMRNYKPSIVPYNSSYGGIIVAKDAVFKNNDRAILLSGYPYNTHSSFENCSFEYAEGFAPSAQVPELVKLQNMYGVLFEGCSFTDNRLNVVDEDKITGIESYHSSFQVLPLCTQNVLPPCPAVYQQPNRFNNLHYGIHASNFTPSLIIEVDSALFVNNINACYLSATAYANVTRCGFTTRNNATGGYGLYLDESEEYTIEENRFEQGIDNINSVGLIINHNGPLGDNIVYRNTFYDHQYPVLAQNDNRSPVDQGLQFKCNVFDPTCKFNVMVTSDGPFNTAYTGIAAKQGADLGQPDAPAGNIFSWTGPTGTATDIYNETNGITYYYHLDANYNLLPKYYSGSVHPISVFGAQWNGNSCPPSIESGGSGDTEGLKNLVVVSETKADSVEAIINLLKDGGSTDGLKAEVDLSTPPETYTVYSELMNASPYISDTVMEAAIEKEEVLPNVMIRDVMVANPHNAKNELLMDKIDERLDPMPDYMKAQIVQGRSLVSVFEELQSQLAFYRQQRKLAFSSLVTYYRSDTVNAVSSADSLRVLLENENSPDAKYQLAFLHLEQEAGGLGQSILNALPSEFNLTAEELELHQHISTYYNMLVDLGQEDKRITDVDSLQIEALFEMEALQAGAPSVYARNILLALGEISYTEPILLPDFSKSSAIQQEYIELQKALSEHHFLRIFPNPAGDYLIVEHQLEMETQGAYISIVNVKGEALKQVAVNGKLDQQTLDIKNFKTGNYIVTLYINDRVIESVKFSKGK